MHIQWSLEEELHRPLPQYSRQKHSPCFKCVFLKLKPTVTFEFFYNIPPTVINSGQNKIAWIFRPRVYWRNGSKFDWPMKDMSINQKKGGRKEFRRGIWSGSIFRFANSTLRITRNWNRAWSQVNHSLKIYVPINHLTSKPACQPAIHDSV